jgi:hypothetical protein
MKPGTLSDTTKTTKKMAQQAAKQIAAEPFEILKTAGKQVAGAEKPAEKSVETGGQPFQPEPTSGVDRQVQKQKSEAQGKRIITALENEIEAIRREKENEKVKAAMAEEQQKQAAIQEKPPLIEPATKQSRNIFAFVGRLAKKASGLIGVKRQQRQTEMAKSPTG